MAVSFFLEKVFKPLNGSYLEGILDYMDMLTIVKKVDWIFIG